MYYQKTFEPATWSEYSDSSVTSSIERIDGDLYHQIDRSVSPGVGIPLSIPRAVKNS